MIPLSIHRKLSGFSIIELMIVVLLIGLALSKGIPFTAEWVNSARVTEVESALSESIALAKAKALRNAMGIVSGKAVSAVCFGDEILQVYESKDEISPAECGGNAVQIWQETLPSNVTITLQGNEVSCLCFDAKGKFTLTGACNNCATNTTFILTAGSTSETVEIY
jgi:type II secretory pathway pseudopilin PulG